MPSHRLVLGACALALIAVSVAAEPNVVQPTGTQPSTTQPAGTQPSTTQAAATQPSTTQPAGTQPSTTQAAATQPVSTETLLREMADLRGLAEWPAPAFTCKQFSSYDRASTTPADAKSWFANADFGHFLREEERDGRKEFVLMDADGPGAIVRLWSANPSGTLRIYLDGAEQPALESPLGDLLSGKTPGIPEPLAHKVAEGWNCYFPIPYARHCKVTCDAGGFYYHVNYRTYPAGTAVRTFTRDDLEAAVGQIATIVKRLESPGAAVSFEVRKGGVASSAGVYKLDPGEGRDFIKHREGGAIRELKCEVETKGDREVALRGLLLTMRFDDEQTVSVPLGDFFGAGPGLKPYQSLPLGLLADGALMSRWFMPFQKNAVIRLHNHGTVPVKVKLIAQAANYEWTDNSMHFGAGWRVQRDVPTRPFIDWNYVDLEGQGVFVGAAFSLVNPHRLWWGEGDEKIYVDGEKFPSTFGTGTEDYFGYAWCSPALFTHAYHNQPQCDGPDNWGRTAVNRWHVLDRIPFTREFRFDMELWHSQDVRVPEMSVTTYWYARPGAKSRLAALTAADLKLTAAPKYEPPKTPGALEGEELKVLAVAGRTEAQVIDGCSGDAQLWWVDGKVGDRIALGLPAEQAGRYKVYVRMVTARDYGVHQAYVNGQKLGEAIDSYSERLQVAPERLLGVVELTAGENRLEFEIVGANEKAKQRYLMGLDYVRMEKE